MLDFSTNTNSLGPPHSLIRVLRENVFDVSAYPDYKNKKILSACGRFFGVSFKNIGLGTGSTQILFNIPKMLQYKRAVIIVPTFWEYANFNLLFKRRIKKINLLEEDNFEPNYESIQKNIRSGDCVFICNVNNPTSSIYVKHKLLGLIKGNPHVQFVIDETYLLFRSDYTRQSVVKYVQKQKNLHVVTSLSKLFAIPGMRVGIFVSNRKIIELYNKLFYVPYSINSYSSKSLIDLLSNGVFVEETRNFYDAERKRLYEIIKKKLSHRLRCIEPHGNFIFVRILTSQTSQDIETCLKRRGIIIRGGHELLGVTNKWFRFSIGKKKDNNRFIRELNKVVH